MRKSRTDQHHVVKPLEPKPQLQTVDHKADIVQITKRTGRSA